MPHNRGLIDIEVYIMEDYLYSYILSLAILRDLAADAVGSRLKVNRGSYRYVLVMCMISRFDMTLIGVKKHLSGKMFR